MQCETSWSSEVWRLDNERMAQHMNFAINARRGLEDKRLRESKVEDSRIVERVVG